MKGGRKTGWREERREGRRGGGWARVKKREGGSLRESRRKKVTDLEKIQDY